MPYLHRTYRSRYSYKGDVTHPQLGDVARASDLGYKAADGKAKYIFVACVECGQQRWVQLHVGKPQCVYCRHCWQLGQRNITYRKLGVLSPKWKGGRVKFDSGYIFVYITNSDPFYSMASTHIKNGYRGYVQEHRLVMARSLGRVLTHDEHVHHINGDKGDNRIVNLRLETPRSHKTGYIGGYRDGYNEGYQAALKTLESTR